MAFITAIAVTFVFTLVAGSPVTPDQLESGVLPLGNDPAPPCSTNENVSLTSGAKNGQINPRYRWKNFILYPNDRFTNEERQKISDAVSTLSKEIPCVKFSLRTSRPTERDYVEMKRDANEGCHSSIGRRGGPQLLNLAPGCMQNGKGIIMHEMIHALGFFHEQSRPDRDNYVTF